MSACLVALLRFIAALKLQCTVLERKNSVWWDIFRGSNTADLPRSAVNIRHEHGHYYVREE